MPSDPEFASIPGTPTSGCPSSPPSLLRRRNRSRGNDSEPEERRVEAGHVVPLRGEEDVSIGMVEPELADVQLVVEQVHDKVERAEAGAEVAGPGALDRDERVQAAEVGEQREPRVGIALRHPRAVELGLRGEPKGNHTRDAIGLERGASHPAMPRRTNAGTTGTA